MPLETVRGPGERAGARVRTRVRVHVVKLAVFTPIALHNPVRPLQHVSRALARWHSSYTLAPGLLPTRKNPAAAAAVAAAGWAAVSP